MDSTNQDLRLTTLVVATVFIIIFLIVNAVENESVILGYIKNYS